MEKHETEDYGVESHGTARVFGYRPLNMGVEHDIYGAVWEAADDAYFRGHDITAIRDFQTCAVSGIECAWCDEPATGYIRLSCDCNGTPCREWVCFDCGGIAPC